MAIGIVNTRIRDFKVSNTRPVVGETVEFTGYLEWHLWPLCLPEKEVVYNCLEPKNIEEVKCGDQLASKSGVSTVNKVYVSDYKGRLLCIKPMGLLPVRLTPGHFVLAARRESVKGLLRLNIKRRYNIRKGLGRAKPLPLNPKLEWVSADELRKGDFVCIPRLKLEEDYVIDLSGYSQAYPEPRVKLDEEVAWLLGWYAAEGSATAENSTIQFALSSDEREVATRLCDILRRRFGLAPKIIDRGNSIVVQAYSKALSAFLREQFGESSKERVIPRWLIKSRRSVLKSFLLAYMHGDGCFRKRGNRNSIDIVTSSKKLVYSLILAFAKLGLRPTVYYTPPHPFTIRGRTCRSSGCYTLEVDGTSIEEFGMKHERSKTKTTFITTDDFVLTPICRIWSEEYSGKVYDFETSDHTYAAPIIVHNCTWYGADSRVVKVLVDGTEVGSGMTTAQGFFRVYWRPTSPGSYIAKAKFEGTVDQNPCESPPIAITVLTEEQKKEEQQRLWITIAAIAGVCATGLIGFGLYMDYQRRREEMMTLLAARR